MNGIIDLSEDGKCFRDGLCEIATGMRATQIYAQAKGEHALCTFWKIGLY
jgi:hypothetical protein